VPGRIVQAGSAGSYTEKRGEAIVTVPLREREVTEAQPPVTGEENTGRNVGQPAAHQLRERKGQT